MQQSTLLKSLQSVEANDTQRKISLAQIVKEAIEGIITPGQIYATAIIGLAAEYQLDGISVVVDPDTDHFTFENNVLTFNPSIGEPTTATYLLLLEGLGAATNPDAKMREDQRRSGYNWVNAMGTELFKSFMQDELKEDVVRELGMNFFTLLKSAHGTMVDQYTDAGVFVDDFVLGGKNAENVYRAFHLGAMKVLFDDPDASDMANIYNSIKTGNSGIGTNSDSAEFMSAFLIACFGIK